MAACDLAYSFRAMAPRKIKGKGKATADVQKDPAQAALQTAEEHQQRAERRRGEDAIRQYAQAVAKYEEALQLGLQPTDKSNALVSLSDALQEWAEQVLAVEARLPEAQQSADLAHRSAQQAVTLLERALRVCDVLHDDGGGTWTRADAAVGCGNVKSQLAELQTGEQQVQLLKGAVECYHAAIGLEEDALTWSNIADALMQLAQALADTGQVQDAARRVSESRAAYERATELSHSDEGDDLPGLLCNWGSGLCAAAKIASAAGDRDAAISLLQEATSRLEASVSFNRADIQVETLLGETYVALAEMLPTAEAAPVLRKGLTEGFDAALRIDSTNGATLASKGEAHLLGFRIARELGAVNDQAEQLRCALESFERALQRPEALGSNSERCNVRYNHACALALAGRAAEACDALQHIAERDATVLDGIQSDDDLQGLRALPHFQRVVALLQNGGGCCTAHI